MSAYNENATGRSRGTEDGSNDGENGEGAEGRQSDRGLRAGASRITVQTESASSHSTISSSSPISRQSSWSASRTRKSTMRARDKNWIEELEETSRINKQQNCIMSKYWSQAGNLEDFLLPSTRSGCPSVAGVVFDFAMEVYFDREESPKDFKERLMKMEAKHRKGQDRRLSSAAAAALRIMRESNQGIWPA